MRVYLHKNKKYFQIVFSIITFWNLNFHMNFLTFLDLMHSPACCVQSLLIMNTPGKKILHISSELSQLATRYNWRYLRSKSAIVYDGGKAKCGRGLVHRWLNENCSGQQVQLIPTIGSKFLSLRKCRMFFSPPDLHNFHYGFSIAKS